MLPDINKVVAPFMEPLQFAYRAKRSVDDAIAHVLHTIVEHLDKPGTCIRLMFFDFSSAFNTIQPHLLSDKLMNMNVCPSVILWILDYLSCRPQYVRLNSSLFSSTTITNTGAPQGTVLSPFLFSIYTSECRALYDNCVIDKYADDTVLTGLITNDQDANYRQEIDNFVDWCDANHLILNASKTKEMIIDFRKKLPEPSSITIKKEKIEQVDSFKYLGVIVDNKLSWRENTDLIASKAKQRLYCLRKLRAFNANQKMLQMFFTSVVNSVLTFGLICWGGNISKQDKGRLDGVIRKAGRVVGVQQHDIDTLIDKRTTDKMNVILSDRTHPLRPEYDNRFLERSGRYRAPKTRTVRHAKSFIPRSISLYNKNYKRKTILCNSKV